MHFTGKHVLIIVENLSVPFDRRVWQEATTLKRAGADVSVICPVMKGQEARRETIEGIEIYRHPLPLEARGALGYLIEYGVALFWEFLLSWRIHIKKRFHVIHGCNPPDLIFLISLPFRLFGVKYVFDHHDINPELYIAKYGRRGAFYWLLIAFEWLTFKASNRSIATNESYRAIALSRGGMKPELVTVIRSGPSLERMRRLPPFPGHKKGRRFLIGYVGVIGAQEGIDLLLESMAELLRHRQDVQLAILGGGTDLDRLKEQCHEMGLDGHVDFYGRVNDELLLSVLNTADVCVNPDRPTVMNNLSTMNKIMEYMALGKPIVQYDLREGRFSAMGASLYARPGETSDFSNCIARLLDEPELRAQMGEFGHQRVLQELSWEHEAKRLIEFYGEVFGVGRATTRDFQPK